MAREIKFRVWEPTQKYYFHDVAVYPNGVAALQRHNIESAAVKSAFGSTLWTEFPREAVIEQYTGLKDKNGKEIYEGDIVKCILGNKPIVFHDCRYWLGETLDDLFVANLRYDIEVIGNIHENPELLTGSDIDVGSKEER